MEYAPKTPDPFSPPHFWPRPPTRGKKGLARESSTQAGPAQAAGRGDGMDR